MTTDNKTMAVDVLAVMLELDDELQSAANYSGEGCYWSVDDDDLLQRSAAARAAFAELIEADEEYDEAWRDMAGRTHTALRREKAGIRRARALARVKGESA
jgi:hypothetical protein